MGCLVIYFEYCHFGVYTDVLFVLAKENTKVSFMNDPPYGFDLFVNVFVYFLFCFVFLLEVIGWGLMA